ncbi:MAG: peptidoglycan DD-metalloendopeptidase family protein [Candidatus Moranbacteria bacterium]|nr:peptidoglycan DD-metalloendopeptidase family protein [Candidatus Moranbacteria bacterium]
MTGIVLSALYFSTFSFANASLSFNCDDYEGDMKDECEEKQKTARTLESIIKLKEKQADVITTQLDTINKQQEKNVSDLQLTKKTVEDLARKINDLDRDIADKENLIQSQKKLLTGLMQSYYEYDQQGTLDVVLADQDFSTTFAQSDNIEQSEMKVSDILNTIKEARQELLQEKSDISENKEKHSEMKENLEKKGLDLQYTEDQKQKLLGQTQAEKEKYEKQLNDVRNEIYDLESNKSVDYGNIPAAKGGYFDYPVSKPSITQSYGCLQNSFAKASYPACNGGKGGFHNGFDFGSNSGSTIFAVKSGKVIGSGNNGRYAYGQWIAIDHGDGLVTLYGHLSKKYVSKGDQVDDGEKIGIMGNTGYSTGTHLHFSVFDKKSFETVESTKVDGLILPTGASVSPGRYLK